MNETPELSHDERAAPSPTSARATPRLKGSVQASDYSVPGAPTKRCINCGTSMSAALLLCPKCRMLQDAAMLERENRRRAKYAPRRRHPLMHIGALCFLMGILAVGYQRKDAILATWASILGRVSSARPSDASGEAEAHQGDIPENSEAVVVGMSSPQRESSRGPEPAPAPRPTPPAHQAAMRTAVTSGHSVTVIRPICPLCGGKGELAEPASKRWTYACPVCLGRGVRELRLEPGQKLCGHCGGMGRLGRLDDFWRNRKRYVADPCKVCRGKGVEGSI